LANIGRISTGNIFGEEFVFNETEEYDYQYKVISDEVVFYYFSKDIFKMCPTTKSLLEAVW